MSRERRFVATLAASALFVACGSAFAQPAVTYGKITAVKAVTKENKEAQVAGAVTGGMIGLLSGRGHSGSNKALRTIGGGFAGQQIGRLASNRQAYEYTILVGEATTRLVTDEAGLRVGDCVALERGGHNNLRLVEDERCAPPRAGTTKPAPRPVSSEAKRAADLCIKAKDQLLEAETEEAFDRAERRVRLLCDD